MLRTLDYLPRPVSLAMPIRVEVVRIEAFTSAKSLTPPP